MIKIGRHVFDLLSTTYEPSSKLHWFLPNGFSMLAGPPKIGKSFLSEQLAWDLSKKLPVLYLALEYQGAIAKQRFAKFTREHRLHIVLGFEINRFGEGGEKQMNTLLDQTEAKVLIVDTLTHIKRTTQGGYDAETAALNELKKLTGEKNCDTLIIHHTKKVEPQSQHNPVDLILGSTAIAAVPDNLIIMLPASGGVNLNISGRTVKPDTLFLKRDKEKWVEAKSKTSIEDSAPRQAEILNILSKRPFAVNELSQATDMSIPNVSRACRILKQKNLIKRKDRNHPWELSSEEEG